MGTKTIKEYSFRCNDLIDWFLSQAILFRGTSFGQRLGWRTKTGVCILNQCHAAFQVAQLYKNRWQVELFFKWLKQHLKVKKF